MLKESLRMGFIERNSASQLINISKLYISAYIADSYVYVTVDVNKTGKLFDFFVASGWVNNHMKETSGATAPEAAVEVRVSSSSSSPMSSNRVTVICEHDAAQAAPYSTANVSSPATIITETLPASSEQVSTQQQSTAPPQIPLSSLHPAAVPRHTGPAIIAPHRADVVDIPIESVNTE